MPRLIYSPESLLDIGRLHAFLQRNDPHAARRAIQAMRASRRKLANRPEIGRPAARMPDGFREWPIRFGTSGYIAL